MQRINPEGFKKVTEVAKAGAAKWATLTPDEKKPYEDDAAERKVRLSFVSLTPATLALLPMTSRSAMPIRIT